MTEGVDGWIAVRLNFCPDASYLLSLGTVPSALIGAGGTAQSLKILFQEVEIEVLFSFNTC